MIKHSVLNSLHTVERAARECCAVLVIGIGGAGRVSGRTGFRASRTLHGVECPHQALVEFDLTSKTGRQDTDLVTPNTPGRLIVHIVQPVNAAAVVARFGDDKVYAPFKAIDPNVIKNLPQTDHLGGCAVPAGARIAIEVHQQEIAELAVKIGQLADLIRMPHAGWRCNGSLWVIVHASSAGAVGSNDIHISEMLCRHIHGQHRVLSGGLLIAENGRVPNRDESLGLEAAHMTLVRAVARHAPRSAEPPFAHTTDFWTFFRQSQADEREVYSAAATTTALISKAALEGELQTLETRVNRLSEGARCFLCDTRAVCHSPEMLAEFATGWAIERGASAVVERADLRPAPIVTRYTSEWQALGSTGAIVTRACASQSDRTGAAITQLRSRLALRIGGGAEIDRALIAELPAAVQNITLDDVVRSIERQVRALSDEHHAHAIDALAAGRPDEALAIADVIERYGAAQIGEVDAVQREAKGEADAALADANAVVARAAEMDELRSDSRSLRLWNWFSGWFAGPSEAAAPNINTDLRGRLEAYAAAALRSRLASRLRTTFSHLVGRVDELKVRVQGELALLRTLAAAAADQRRRVEQDADALKADIAGLVTIADSHIRDTGVRSILPADTDDSLRSIVMGAVESTRGHTGRAEITDVYADALGRVRRLTDSLRSLDLDALIRLLDDSGLAKLATALQPQSTVEFRTDQPRPQQTVRYAVPGGEDGPLGRWLRVNLRDVQPLITNSRGSQLAYAVRVTAPFAIDDLQAYQTIYPEARDLMRQQGREAYLVSDRRHLGLDDGIETDERMDQLFVRGLICGAIMASRGGTFYKIPDGEHRRPADVKPSELDAVFGRLEKGGGRLGNSVPDFRSSLRAAVRVRDGIEERWTNYLLGTSPNERLQQTEMLQRNGLPSPELDNALRQLCALAEEEAIRHGRVATARRPATVSGINSVRSEA